ncbi:leucyl aminopeptidase, partial [Candidatus Pelagibacter sp.]|nr:leucyl aminopeptidase [Candidatus Pelagibacter sp.]
MSIKINYLNKLTNKTSTNLVLFTDEKLNISGLKNYISNSEFSYLNDLLKTNSLKKNLFVFEVSSRKKIFLVSVKNNLETSDIENLGAEFYGHINCEKKSEYFINSNSINGKYKNFIGYFLHGLKLKSYEFNLYKSIKKKNLISINVIGIKNNVTIQNELRFKAIEEGTFFARDLVSEPPNVLNPKEYTNRLLKLRKLGIKVTVYNEIQMKKLGMHSLLGVGRGSINESFL